MRKLWVQLSLAFGTVVVISAILLGIVGQLGERRASERLSNAVLFGDEGIITELQAHFDEGGTASGAVRILRDAQRDLRRLPFRVSLALINANDRPLIDTIPAGARFREITFERDGRTVATLRYDTGNTSPRPQDNRQQAPNPPRTNNNRFFMIIILGTVLGIGGGIVMSRQLTKPLSQLADSARQFGGRDFSTRIKVEGTEEVREVATAFNEMASALQESENLRNNLIADVAHELRTPMTVMIGNLRAIIDDVYPLSKTEIMHLYEHTRQLSRLINDLHELALADARELTLFPSETDIASLVHEAIDIFQPVAEAENITLSADISPNLPTLHVDSGRIRQVIHNLLVNALHHTPENGSVIVQASQQEKMLVITIVDTGVGIPAEHLPHIFERFYRAEAARDRQSGGTGLGLAIGKGIIEAHGGTISVTSSTQLPSGTRFTIKLPIQSAMN